MDPWLYWTLCFLVQKQEEGAQFICLIYTSASYQYDAKEKDLLYIWPLDKKPQDPNLPWYSTVPLGKHTLQQKVKKICADAGVCGNKTNHSLRATGATELYKRGAPEKLIQERTGYRSLESPSGHTKGRMKSNTRLHQLCSRSLLQAGE